MAERREDYAQAAVMTAVINFYLNESCQFNGMPFEDDGVDPSSEPTAALVRAGLVQVVSGEDWMNPHIRPWASRRSAESQVESLRSGQRVCPTCPTTGRYCAPQRCYCGHTECPAAPTYRKRTRHDGPWRNN